MTLGTLLLHAKMVGFHAAAAPRKPPLANPLAPLWPQHQTYYKRVLMVFLMLFIVYFDGTRQIPWSLWKKCAVWFCRWGVSLEFKGVLQTTIWKNYHDNSCMTILFNIESFTLNTWFTTCLFLHCSQFSKSCLHLTPMILGSLVLLSSCHLIFDSFDLVSYTHFLKTQ